MLRMFYTYGIIVINFLNKEVKLSNMKKIISLQMSRWSISKLDILASKKGVSRSEIIRDILSSSNDLKSDEIEEMLIEFRKDLNSFREDLNSFREETKAINEKYFCTAMKFSASMFCQLINLHRQAQNRTSDEYQDEVNFMFKDPKTYANFLLSKTIYDFDNKDKDFEKSEKFKKLYEKFFSSVV